RELDSSARVERGAGLRVDAPPPLRGRNASGPPHSAVPVDARADRQGYWDAVARRASKHRTSCEVARTRAAASTFDLRGSRPNDHTDGGAVLDMQNAKDHEARAPPTAPDECRVSDGVCRYRRSERRPRRDDH